MGESVCVACGKRDCAERVCVTCRHLRFNRRTNHADRGFCCGECVVLLTAAPEQISSAYELLPELLEPGAHGGDGRSKNPEAPLPLALEPLDLTARWTSPQGPIRLARLAANAGDQIGSLPVRETLGGWVRDWLERRDVGESGPGSAVWSMCEWLTVRTEWACEDHPAVDEYCDEVVSLRGLLHTLVGREQPDERPKPIPGVPCIRCRFVSLVRRHDGTVECTHEDCRRVYSPEEYERVTKAAAWAARRAQAPA